MKKESWLKVGATVMVHGVNDDYVGRITEFLPGRVVVLEETSWVAFSGRLSEFIAKGEAEGMEVEYVGDHTEHWTGISRWPHKVPLKTK